ncbi:MAG: hypothetical protein AB1344_09225 [Pseudomonadota bacterium]
MEDIIPPLPVHEGLAGLIEGGGGVHPVLLIALGVLVVGMMIVVLLRHRLLARTRLWRAIRLLDGGQPVMQRAARLDHLLRQHHQLPLLHPERPPTEVDATVWRTLVTTLHATRFGIAPPDLKSLYPLLRTTFLPSPLKTSLDGRTPRGLRPGMTGGSERTEQDRGDSQP